MERIEIVLSDVDSICEIGSGITAEIKDLTGICTDGGQAFRLDVDDCRRVAPLFRRPVKLTLIIEELQEGK